MVDDSYDDVMFDVAAVEAGAWAPGPYGPDDERGSFNEVTPEKTAAALSLLDLTRPVQTYNLSETLFNGFPALSNRGEWGRTYEQTLQVMGYQPGPGFEGLLLTADPVGNNHVSTHEERVRLTYNMGTKINGLTHVGVGPVYYNGFRGPEFARTWGTEKLGIEKAGPIVTRGVLIDVVGSSMRRVPPVTISSCPTVSRCSTAATGSRSKTCWTPCAGRGSRAT